MNFRLWVFLVSCHSDTPCPAVLTVGAIRWHSTYYRFHHYVLQGPCQMLVPLGIATSLTEIIFVLLLFMSLALFSLLPAFPWGDHGGEIAGVINWSAGYHSSIKLSIHQACSAFEQVGAGWLIFQNPFQVMERLSPLYSSLHHIRNLSNFKLFQYI